MFIFDEGNATDAYQHHTAENGRWVRHRQTFEHDGCQ
jgi:hypothetical protein